MVKTGKSVNLYFNLNTNNQILAGIGRKLVNRLQNVQNSQPISLQNGRTRSKIDQNWSQVTSAATNYSKLIQSPSPIVQNYQNW